MATFHAKTVFFVRDAAVSLAFYTKDLGFALDWMHEENGGPHVFQVSLHGFELILNRAEAATGDRPGHGRAFIGLDAEGSAAFRHHVESKRIKTSIVHWGAPTIAIHDPDQNELFFWLPEAERQNLEVGSAGVA